MLCTTFNQDSTCFAYGTEYGFAVYNCDPPTVRFKRFEQNRSGIGVLDLLDRSNLLALVGGGPQPRYSPNTLIIWDDYKNDKIAELEFNDPVVGVKLHRQLILVSTISKAYLYRLEDIDLVKSFDTINPKGLLSLAPESLMVAVPGSVKGTVIVDSYKTSKRQIIIAHENSVAAMVLNKSGTRLATASDRGTIIRVWDTASGELVREFRRGLEVVVITSMCFDSETTRLVVCSDKGTIHVFSLMTGDLQNRKSSLAYIGDYLPAYFSSEWSSISFEVPANSMCTLSSTSVDSIYVVSPDGQFRRYTYDTQTGVGQCIQTKAII
jgi:WD repeat-containing protein 45